LRLIIEREPDLRVIAEAGDGREALEQAIEHQPDLAIVDVSMPFLNGLGVARELRKRAPSVRILMLSMHDNEQFFFEALRAGADGYLLKSAVDYQLPRGVVAPLLAPPGIRRAPRPGLHVASAVAGSSVASIAAIVSNHRTAIGPEAPGCATAF
jgi:CheY-like chemotaxis protein